MGVQAGLNFFLFKTTNFACIHIFYPVNFISVLASVDFLYFLPYSYQKKLTKT